MAHRVPRLRVSLGILLGVALLPGAASSGETDPQCAGAEARIAALERENARLRANAPGPLFGSPTAWKDPRSWVRLRRGMSRYEVMGTLGEPGRIVRYDAFERWEYPDFLGGRVTIGEGGRLGGWRAPGARAAAR